MKSFELYIKDERNLEMPKGEIPGSWFAENGFPMIVACTCCSMTMALPSAFINDEGYVFCSDCAGAIEENGGE